MQIIVQKDLANFHAFARVPDRLIGSHFREEMYRGVRDAGKKMLTVVRKTAVKQMGLKPGLYGSFVVANTQGIPNKLELSYSIAGGRKGAPIENYKGLKVLAAGGKPSRAGNKGRAVYDRGVVKSSVWNVARIFKRSFSTGTGLWAFRPGNGTRSFVPKSQWTFGAKPNQLRDGDGRFVSKHGPRGKGKVRRLYGPSLYKELSDGNSVKKGPNMIHMRFMKEGPAELEMQVNKRLAKFVKY